MISQLKLFDVFHDLVIMVHVGRTAYNDQICIRMLLMDLRKRADQTKLSFFR